MKAQLLTAFGPDAPFELTELPVPALRPGHVLIKVSAASVNPADYKARELGHLLDFVPPLPATLGMDVAGTIAEVGEGVSRFRAGDRVFGLVGGVSGLPGTLAEYVLADEQLVAHAPASIPLGHAAALPLISITAWQAIRDTGVKAGDKVLVFGGSGNVGRMGIQLAKLQGAFVGAVDHPGRSQTAKAAGADVVFSTEERLEDIVSQYTGGQGFDLVFDTVGGANLPRAFAAARLAGTVVTTIGLASVDLSLMHAKALSLKVVYVLTPLLYGVGRQQHGEILTQIAALVDGHALTPPLNQKHFGLEETTQAFDYAQFGKTPGKVIIQIT